MMFTQTLIRFGFELDRLADWLNGSDCQHSGRTSREFHQIQVKVRSLRLR